MLQQTDPRRRNISHFLGGKTRSNNDEWKPDIEAVKIYRCFKTAMSNNGESWNSANDLDKLNSGDPASIRESRLSAVVTAI